MNTLSVEEAATALGLSLASTYKLLRNGEIGFFRTKPKTGFRVPRKEVERWLREREAMLFAGKEPSL